MSLHSNGLEGYIYSIESGSCVDGPGLRYGLFTTGCTYKCLFCHSIDSIKLHNGKLMTVDEIMIDIEKYAKIIDGITISGGCPLVQGEFVGEIFRRAKELGLHTAIDTNGDLAHKFPDSYFDNIDLVLLDIKQINPDKHLVLTGQPVSRVLEFARRLDRLGKKVWIRSVLVPNLTDDLKDWTDLADFVATLSNVDRIEILPFQNGGTFKWDQEGIEYTLRDTLPPTEELVNSVLNIFKKKGLEVY